MNKCLRSDRARSLALQDGGLAQSGRYAALIACALVVDGLMRVQLDTGMPVFCMVPRPKDFHEHADHFEFFKTHFVKKGKEAAQACVRTLTSLAAVV